MGRRATNLERPNIGGSCHWPLFLIPIVLYGWILPTAQAREITATFLMVLVIVGDIAVLSLVTIMLLFANGNLRTTEPQS